jgi:hypothetical protein
MSVALGVVVVVAVFVLGYRMGERSGLHRGGVLTGRDADAILHEMKHGSPNTPERRATLARAAEMHRLQKMSGEATRKALDGHHGEPK